MDGSRHWLEGINSEMLRVVHLLDVEAHLGLLLCGRPGRLLPSHPLFLLPAPAPTPLLTQQQLQGRTLNPVFIILNKLMMHVCI